MLHGRRRILVIGSGGAGKSTFARELAERTGLPLIHMDRHYWKPGWVATPPDAWAECVRELCSGEAWILDGNFGDSLAIRMRRCDAIVFLDLPRLVCLSSALRRRFTPVRETRADLPNGCPESLDWAFLRWIWDYPRASRPRILAALREAGPGVRIVTITRRAQARALLQGS